MPETLPLWITMSPMASPYPPVSEQGEARFYCDVVTLTLWLSVNGSDYVQIAGQIFSEAVAAGFTPKLPVTYATTGALPAGTYNNGVAGVGATFTVTAPGYLTVDSKRVVVNDTILVKNQADTKQNGVYTVTQAGKTVQAILTRRTDSDSGAELLNAFYAITNGNTNKNKQYYCDVATAPVVGTDPITFALFAPVGGGGSGGITAGAGLSKAGNVMSLADSDLVALAADSILGNNTGAPSAPFALSIADVISLLGITPGATANQATADIAFAFGDKQLGTAPQVDEYVDVYVDFDGTIEQWTLGADAGTCTVDIYACTQAQFDGGSTHPVSGDKITASAPPAIASGNKGQSSSLGTWTTAVSAGTWLRFIVTAVSGMNQVSGSLKVLKSV
jgi:phosphotransferase system IIB component